MDALKVFNFLWYLWKRNNWILDPRIYVKDYSKYPIYKPIFLLGMQGDGLTLVSRMLRRHPSVVSPTGNHKYWAGADEMQNVFGPVLPPPLTGIKHKAPHHPILTPPRSWSYASDELLPFYRNTEEDANEYYKKRLKHIIGYILNRFGGGIERPRFIDKSQVYTIKMAFINKLLEENEPHFILITRNPYATIYRAAKGKAGDMRRYSKYLSLDERFDICCQHWINSMKCIEEDKKYVKNFMVVKFEDILTHPERELRKICEFVGIDFSHDMLPQPYHKLPFGIKYKERWYPLNPLINDKYLKEIPSSYVEKIYKHCGEVAEKYGYTPLR